MLAGQDCTNAATALAAKVKVSFLVVRRWPKEDFVFENAEML
jgi:hypothetical protein